MWVNYKYLDNSFVGQYFKTGFDLRGVTMATPKVPKLTSKFQFPPIIWKTKSVTYHFYCIFGKLPKFFNFSDGTAKSYSVELKLHRKGHFFNYWKFHWITFLQTLLFELAHLTLHACKKSAWITEQTLKTLKNKCFVHVLFPVCAILRGILTSGILRARLIIEIWIHSADTLILKAMSYVGYARAAENPFEPP